MKPQKIRLDVSLQMYMFLYFVCFLQTYQILHALNNNKSFGANVIHIAGVSPFP